MASVSDQPQRWSQATVYPDMWVDPDEDPRDSAGVSPEGELATLQDYLTNYRLTLLMKCDGLDAEQLARRSVPPSTMSLLGLLRHLAEVERDWRGWILPGDPPTEVVRPTRRRLRRSGRRTGGGSRRIRRPGPGAGGHRRDTR